MRRILTVTTAIVAGALWFGPTPGWAGPTPPFMPLSGSDGVTGMLDVTATGVGLFSADNVPTNNTIATMPALFTLNPGGSCTGTACHSGTVTETLTVTFTGLSFEGFALTTSPLVLTGTYTAKYGGTILGCASGDKVSPNPGNTDCFAWTGAVNSLGVADSAFDGTLTKDLPIGSTGAKLELVFHNATDWSITPTMTAQIIPAAVATPEPATLAVLGVGMIGLGYVRHRRHGAGAAAA
jgi:PEP-CTERM motif